MSYAEIQINQSCFQPRPQPLHRFRTETFSGAYWSIKGKGKYVFTWKTLEIFSISFSYWPYSPQIWSWSVEVKLFLFLFINKRKRNLISWRVTEINWNWKPDDTYWTEEIQPNTTQNNASVAIHKDTVAKTLCWRKHHNRLAAEDDNADDFIKPLQIVIAIDPIKYIFKEIND